MNRHDQVEAEEAAFAAMVAAGRVEFNVEAAGTVEAPPLPTEEPMVVVTVRLPPELYLRVKREADERGVKPSTCMRELMESALASVDADELVRFGDVQRALAAVVRRPHAA